MAHVREQIRNAAVSALTGLPTTGVRVFKSRKYPLQEQELPGLLVYTMAEESETAALGYPRMINRKLVLRVLGIAKQNASLDDTLDDIAEEVETALASDRTFGGLVTDNQLMATEMNLQTINDEEISDKPIGIIAMDWTVLYRTLETTPGTAV